MRRRRKRRLPRITMKSKKIQEVEIGMRRKNKAKDEQIKEEEGKLKREKIRMKKRKEEKRLG